MMSRVGWGNYLVLLEFAVADVEVGEPITLCIRSRVHGVTVRQCQDGVRAVIPSTYIQIADADGQGGQVGGGGGVARGRHRETTFAVAK